MTVPESRVQVSDLDHQWFSRQVSDAVEDLRSDLDSGLSKSEAEQRLQEQGPNSITTSSGPGALRRLLAQFNQPLIYILLAAAAVTAALDEWIDSAVILAVVLVNAAIGFVEESRAVTALDASGRGP